PFDLPLGWLRFAHGSTCRPIGPCAAAYPVVRFAREAPVGRVQGNGTPVKNELPVSGTERGHHLLAAPTATLVGPSSEGNGDVKDAVLKLVGHVFDKLVGKGSPARHARSSFTRLIGDVREILR